MNTRFFCKSNGINFKAFSICFVDLVPNIIFDPMFPERPNRSAKAKKTMQLLQGVIGHDEDADDVFRLALSVATKRVIVKRPKTAPVLADTVPSFSIKTKNHRFDGYVVCA